MGYFPQSSLGLEGIRGLNLRSNASSIAPAGSGNGTETLRLYLEQGATPTLQHRGAMSP